MAKLKEHLKSIKNSKPRLTKGGKFVGYNEEQFNNLFIDTNRDKIIKTLIDVLNEDLKNKGIEHTITIKTNETDSDTIKKILISYINRTNEKDYKNGLDKSINEIKIKNASDEEINKYLKSIFKWIIVDGAPYKRINTYLEEILGKEGRINIHQTKYETKEAFLKRFLKEYKEKLTDSDKQKINRLKGENDEDFSERLSEQFNQKENESDKDFLERQLDFIILQEFFDETDRTYSDSLLSEIDNVKDKNSYMTYLTGNNLQTGRFLTEHSASNIKTLSGDFKNKDPLSKEDISALLNSYLEDDTDSLIIDVESIVRGVAYSPDGNAIASASDDNTLRIWDARTGVLLRTLQGHTSFVRGVAYSPDGNAIASTSEDNTLRLWDARTGACRATLQGHTNGVNGVAYSPDGNAIASASSDNTLRLWNARTGVLLRTLQGHTSSVFGVAYSPDGNAIASASHDNTLRLWNARTGKLLRTLQGHTSSVLGVAYSPDGNAIASASYDNTLRIWDARTGELLRTLHGHANGVRGVAYSPDGNAIASASYDKTLRLWDARTGACRATMHGHTSSVLSVAYSPDGNAIVTGSWDKTLRLWNLNNNSSRQDGGKRIRKKKST